MPWKCVRPWRLCRAAGRGISGNIACEVGAHMLILAGKAHDLATARKRLVAVLADGSALAKFRGLVEAQGGDVRAIDDPSLLPAAPVIVDVASPRGGHAAPHRRQDGRGGLGTPRGRTRPQGGSDRPRCRDRRAGQGGGPNSRRRPALHHPRQGRASASEVQGALLAGVEYSTRPVAPLPLFYRTLRS